MTESVFRLKIFGQGVGYRWSMIQKITIISKAQGAGELGDSRPLLSECAEATRALFMARDDEAADSHPEAMLQGVRDRGAKSVFIDFLLRLDGRLSRDAILAAISTTIAWGPLVRKRISRLTAETLPWYLRLYGVMVGSTR